MKFNEMDIHFFVRRAKPFHGSMCDVCAHANEKIKNRSNDDGTDTQF